MQASFEPIPYFDFNCKMHDMNAAMPLKAQTTTGTRGAALIRVPGQNRTRIAARHEARIRAADGKNNITVNSSSSQNRSSQQAGERLGSLVTAGPLDFLPRLTLGALLSAQDNLQRLPQDLERLNMILSDSAMDNERKQNQILLDVEDRLVGFVAKGVDVENTVVDTLSQSIPEELKDSLPEYVREILFEKRELPGESSDADSKAKVKQPLATWTITSSGSDSDADIVLRNIREDDTSDDEPFEMTPLTAASTAKGQAAAELVDLRNSVIVLKENVEALKDNKDESKFGMLKLNVREAAQSLSQRIEQRAISSASSGNPDIDAALIEAKELLGEVNMLLV